MLFLHAIGLKLQLIDPSTVQEPIYLSTNLLWTWLVDMLTQKRSLDKQQLQLGLSPIMLDLTKKLKPKNQTRLIETELTVLVASNFDSMFPKTKITKAIWF